MPERDSVMEFWSFPKAGLHVSRADTNRERNVMVEVRPHDKRVFAAQRGGSGGVETSCFRAFGVE